EHTPKTERIADSAPAGIAEAAIALLGHAPVAAMGDGSDPAVRPAAILGDPRLLQRMGVDQRARQVRQSNVLWMQRMQGNAFVKNIINMPRATSDSPLDASSTKNFQLGRPEYSSGIPAGNRSDVSLRSKLIQRDAPDSGAPSSTLTPEQQTKW